MRRDPSVYLYDMVTAARLALQSVHGKSLEDYQADLLLRSAVERQLQIAGEALVQLSRAAPEIAQQLPEHRRIIAFRNILVHGYTDAACATIEFAVEGRRDERRRALKAHHMAP